LRIRSVPGHPRVAAPPEGDPVKLWAGTARSGGSDFLGCEEDRARWAG
jgi:hypothetical protein